MSKKLWLFLLYLPCSHYQFPLWSSLVTSEDPSGSEEDILVDNDCHDLVVKIVIGWFIVGGEENWGARTRQGAVMTNVPIGKWLWSSPSFLAQVQVLA